MSAIIRHVDFRYFFRINDACLIGGVSAHQLVHMGYSVIFPIVEYARLGHFFYLKPIGPRWRAVFPYGSVLQPEIYFSCLIRSAVVYHTDPLGITVCQSQIDTAVLEKVRLSVVVFIIPHGNDIPLDIHFMGSRVRSCHIHIDSATVTGKGIKTLFIACRRHYGHIPFIGVNNSDIIVIHAGRLVIRIRLHCGAADSQVHIAVEINGAAVRHIHIDPGRLPAGTGIFIRPSRNMAVRPVTAMYFRRIDSPFRVPGRGIRRFSNGCRIPYIYVAIDSNVRFGPRTGAGTHHVNTVGKTAASVSLNLQVPVYGQPAPVRCENPRPLRISCFAAGSINGQRSCPVTHGDNGCRSFPRRNTLSVISAVDTDF